MLQQIEPVKYTTEKYQEVLLTIEKIASLNNEDENNIVLNDIYKIAHAFSGQCKVQHLDWQIFESEMAEKLKDY